MDRRLATPLAVIAVLAVTLGLSGCSASDDPAAAGTPNPCDLLTTDDFAVAGIRVDRVRPRETDHGLRCDYSLAASLEDVQVTIIDTTIGAEAFAAGRTLVPDTAVIPDLGAGAYWDERTDSVHVLVGDRQLLVSSESEDVTQEQLVAAARIAAARTPAT